MSFDIFLMCVRNGEKATFKRSLAEEIIGRGALDPRHVLSGVEYVDGGSSIYGADGEDLDGFMFNHFGGDTFWDRLWELMDRTGSFLCWPGDGRRLAVTRADMIAELFPELADNIGPPFIARSGKELAYVLGNEEDPPEAPSE